MKNPSDKVFSGGKHVCPSWCCFTFDNKLRTFFHKPEKMLSPFIQPGYVVLDIGPGQGYFTIPMARMVGEMGKVIAIDIQEKMLEVLMAKAARQKLDNRIIAKLVDPDQPEIEYMPDFVLAFWMVHEVPDQEKFLKTVCISLKTGKYLLIAEPRLHVTDAMFRKTIKIAENTGFEIADRPKIAFSRAVLLKKL